MVIQQFNKLIRNKWFWGAFVFFVVFCFCFDGLFSESSDKGTNVREFGTLGKAPNPEEPVDGNLYAQCREDIDLWLKLTGRKADFDENLLAWKLYAAQAVAAKNAFAISDRSLAEYATKVLQSSGICQGELTVDEYERIVVESLGLTVARFEAFCRHGLIAEMLGVADYPPVGARRSGENDYQYGRYRQAMCRFGLMPRPSLAETEVWASRMEALQSIYDLTDTFTVRFAEFTQTPEERDAVKMSAALLKEWYEKNRPELSLPDLYRVRYIMVDATKSEDVAKCAVAEPEIVEYYTAHGGEFAMTKTYTNGTDLASITNKPYVVATTDDKGNTTVKSKKPLEEVKGEITKKLGQQKNVRRLKEVLTRAISAPLNGQAVTGRLADVAAANGKPEIKTSGWFAKGSEAVVPGFMVSAGSIIPQVESLPARLKYLTLSEEFPLSRFTVVNTDSAVYVIELTEKTPAHVATLDECRGKVDERVLASAQEKAFKAKVDAVIAKGADAVLATPGASTNLTFTLTANADVPQDVIRAAVTLGKGQVSDGVFGRDGKAKVVVCVDRKPSQVGPEMKKRAAQELEQGILFQRRLAGLGWGDDYLTYVGFTPGDRDRLSKTSQQ